MSSWEALLMFICSSQCYEYHITPVDLKHLDHMKHIASFNDAQHRGPKWYDYDESGTGGSDSDFSGDVTETTSSELTESDSSSSSSDVSSVETKEEERATKVYRTCTPCPYDMLKKYKNLGIKWICGSYQRARRTFKSECMMRYRNCQDGTMFVKIHERRCKNDTYHGRHWFYDYRV